MKEHLLHQGGLTKSVIEGDVKDHIGKRRSWMEYMKQIMTDMGKNRYKVLKELCDDRDA